MKILKFLLVLMTLTSLTISCKKKYERPDQYTIDLFENERNEQPKKILNQKEASEKSLLVLKTNSIELTDHLKINDKKVNIYKINSGTIVKSAKDSLRFPIKIISNYDLNINSQLTDSTTIYLINPQSYKLLITDLGISYQTLSSAPVSK